jgi:hypothetical protein
MTQPLTSPSLDATPLAQSPLGETRFPSLTFEEQSRLNADQETHLVPNTIEVRTTIVAPECGGSPTSMP